jgi:hypothetical protein
MNSNNFSNHTIIINNNSYECKAGGILPYIIKNNSIYFLLQHSNNKIYSDFGGKREKTDQNIIQTVAREFSEETNGLFFNNNSLDKNLSLDDSIKKSRIIIESLLLHNDPLYIYNYNGKYIIYLLELYSINKNNFGNIENFTKINRKCEWVKSEILVNEHFINNNLQYRLRKGLKNCINKLLLQLYKNNYIN